MKDSATGGRDAGIGRGWIVGIGSVAIAVGVVAFLVPGATMRSVAILFGIHLILLGAIRVVIAVTALHLGGRRRWTTGSLGTLIVAIGALCVANPWDSLPPLGAAIGAGWVADGLVAASGAGHRVDQLRWLPVTAGLAAAVTLSVLMPVLLLTSFIDLAAILLIIVGITTLLLLLVPGEGTPAVVARRTRASGGRAPGKAGER